jgi:phosphoribosylglycinamide formyltransferase-1
MKVAVLVSGSGTNLQALIDAQKEGRLGRGELSLVVSSKPGVSAIEKAEKAGINALTIVKKGLTIEEFDSRLEEVLTRHGIELVVLAGFLSVLGFKTLTAYKNKIINVHPSLIPSFCGKGFYGLRVHEEVLKYGVKITGATVHYVNEVIDGGKIILQKAVEVLPGDTPETLQQRVMREAEWVILPEAVKIITGSV